MCFVCALDCLKRLWNFRLCISCIVMNFNGSLAWALFVDCYSSFMNL